MCFRFLTMLCNWFYLSCTYLLMISSKRQEMYWKIEILQLGICLIRNHSLLYSIYYVSVHLKSARSSFQLFTLTFPILSTCATSSSPHPFPPWANKTEFQKVQFDYNSQLSVYMKLISYPHFTPWTNWNKHYICSISIQYYNSKQMFYAELLTWSFFYT